MARAWILSFILVGVLALTAITAPGPVYGAETVKPAAISSFTVTTRDGGDVTGRALRAGATYQIDLTLTVAEGLEGELTLDTALQKTGDIYWRLRNEYAGIDTKSWQPGSPSISFSAVAGEAELTVTGMVPEDYAMERLANGEVLHLPKEIQLVGLYLTAQRSLVDVKRAEVIDQSIENFRQALEAKEELLNTTKAEPTFAQMVRSSLAIARSQADAGYIDRATEILKAIPDSGWPQPQSRGMTLYAATGGLGLLALIFLLLFLRANSASGFLRRRVDDQLRKLDLAEAKVLKTGNSALASEIGEVKLELEKISRG